MGNVPKGRLPSWMKAMPKPETENKVQRNGVLRINGVELYKTARHKNTSAKHRRTYPYCYTCAQEGIIKLGDMMDHIIPVNVGGDPWDKRNRQTMCTPCHNVKRGKEAHGHCEPWELNDDGKRIPKKLRYEDKN